VARIVELEVEALADPYNPQLLIRLTSDDGYTGVGETWWGTYQPMSEPATPVLAIGVLVETLLRPLTVGQPCDTVADIEALWQRLVRATIQYGHEGIVSTAISGVDIAAWDLVATRQGTPVTALLGPVVHESLPVYASLTWLGDADRVCRDAERALGAGIRAVKLHEANVDLICEVRERLGPGVPLMVDASARFDEDGAIAAAQRLAAADLVWFEEPVYPQSDHAALARVRALAPMPIAAGENEFSLAGFERLIASGAVDIVQPEIAKFGGLTPARGIAELCDTARLPMYPHNYSLGPSLLANVHWAFTSPAARWLEVPWLSEGGTFPCALPMPTLVDGCVLPPTAPGLGYTGR
jgi:L-alanine-DL-glutamate epimerase-like enolase superfamily enzyme